MGGTADPLIRHVAVGISAESMLHQWARQEAAPAGAAVVVGTEIAARTRGGVEWRHRDAIAVAVLGRPVGLDPSHADLAWAAAGVGAAEALDELLGGSHGCMWPDRISGGPPDVEIVVSASSALGPGRIDHVALIARVGPWRSVETRDQLVATLIGGLRRSAQALADPLVVLGAYRKRCALIDEHVEVTLLPHGSLRGRVVTFDETFSLVLQSATGLRDLVPVGSVAQVHLVPAPPA